MGLHPGPQLRRWCRSAQVRKPRHCHGGVLVMLIIGTILVTRCTFSRCGAAWSAVSAGCARPRAAVVATSTPCPVVAATLDAVRSPTHDGNRAEVWNRRGAIGSVSFGLFWFGASSGAAWAEVIKGNAPPEGYGTDTWRNKNFGKAKRCTSLAECQELGRQNEDIKFGTDAVAYQKTASGIRYRDIADGSKRDGVAAPGSMLRLKYRVMRQGKRNRDGLSGEATTLFSLGFGEDDGPADGVLTAKLGEGRFVKALEEGIAGMAVGGTRRVQVRPDQGMGWKKVGQCATASYAVGALAGLPGAGAENEEACLDESLLPQPGDYGAKRRFARRFDESLIVEVQLVGVDAS